MFLDKLLFKHIDNSALIVFRILFGLLIFLESVGAIFTGWVKRTLIDPKFTFSFIGFEWLQPLPGPGMYVYYLAMGALSIMVMLGYRYRLAMFTFTLLWTGTYLMQKSAYNNHYYLLILLSAMMIILPANRYRSLDVKRKPSLMQNSMPRWCGLIIIVQLFIVYTYASIAKMYPDWLDLTVARNLMAVRKDYMIIGDVIQKEWFLYFIAYAGILFDLLIVPALLWKPTRKWAFFASIFFHLFNSIIFQIGIFPYLSLAFTLFFFEPEVIQKLFLKKKEFYAKGEVIVPNYKKQLLLLTSLYFIVQIGLPLRHWFIADDVLWTEEGHRMSWRMMLRSKLGSIRYKVVDKKTGNIIPVSLDDYLTPKQKRSASTKPDVIWQFAQKLKKDFGKQGTHISVFVDSRLSVNGKPFKPFIDPDTDLAAQEWEAFNHSDWILPSE